MYHTDLQTSVHLPLPHITCISSNEHHWNAVNCYFFKLNWGSEITSAFSAMWHKWRNIVPIYCYTTSYCCCCSSFWITWFSKHYNLFCVVLAKLQVGRQCRPVWPTASQSQMNRSNCRSDTAITLSCDQTWAYKQNDNKNSYIRWNEIRLVSGSSSVLPDVSLNPCTCTNRFPESAFIYHYIYHSLSHSWQVLQSTAHRLCSLFTRAFFCFSKEEQGLSHRDDASCCC